MGQVIGTDHYQASGYIGAAVLGQQVTLSFQDFQTSAPETALEAVLTINGNLAKRHLDLGPLPQGSTAFEMAVPPGTDMSLFNTVVIRLKDQETIVCRASVP
ncbi:MAG TPA: hypothetical protein IGR64_14230 [Leptolyngbyaceae cyanobacterium M65_K2018_010]|nr:hypothetical protein [Leptolyngbyaceae cyanobacterium M65_K2018_010]